MQNYLFSHTLLLSSASVFGLIQTYTRRRGLRHETANSFIKSNCGQRLCDPAGIEVHNHHNYAWKETHNGKEVVVVRKGATPSAPGQIGFIGGSMGDISVIVKGKDSIENKDSYYSTVHGAGRIMSRIQAAGKMNWKTRTRSGGQITSTQMMKGVQDFGVKLRGAGKGESPFLCNFRNIMDLHGGLGYHYFVQSKC